MNPSIQLRSLPQLKAVVFDMDGVIVDSHPAHRLAWKEFLHTLGKEVSESELDFVMDGRKREDILIHFLGPLSAAQLQDYGRQKNELFLQTAHRVVPIPGAFEFIECLHRAGVTIAVATSASASRTHFTLRRAGLLNHFRAVVTGDEVRKGKPDPDIYQMACQRVSCPPHSAVAVEDALSGVRAAKSAGLRCIGVAHSRHWDRLIAAGADSVLQDFVDLTLPKFHSLVGMEPPQSPRNVRRKWARSSRSPQPAKPTL